MIDNIGPRVDVGRFHFCNQQKWFIRQTSSPFDVGRLKRISYRDGLHTGNSKIVLVFALKFF